MPCDQVAVFTATLLTQDAREILESRETLETLVTVLVAALERKDISILEYNAARQIATLKVGSTNIYLSEGQIYARDSWGSQASVDELGDTVQAVAKMLAGRLRSNRVVKALEENNVPIVSDEVVEGVRLVKVLV